MRATKQLRQLLAVKMAKTKIYSVCTVETAILKQSKRIAEYFNVDIDELEELSDIKEVICEDSSYKEQLSEQKKESGTIDIDGFYFCFSKMDNLVCPLTEFKDCDHKFMIPGKFDDVAISTPIDKLAVLIQINKYNLDGVGILRWRDLLVPQLRDIAKQYGVTLKKDESLEKLAQRIEKSALFGKAFGRMKMGDLEFKFNKEDPHNCLLISKAIKDNEIGESSKSLGSNGSREELKNNLTSSQASKDTDKSPVELNKECLLTEMKKDQFPQLLDIFELRARPDSDWDLIWNILQCSKYFLNKFGEYEAKDINVYWKGEKIVNLMTTDGSISLNNNKSVYPCVECCKEVTNRNDETGEGLMCSKCSRYFHNQCMAKPVSKTLLNALADSPEYIQIYCPNCMENNSKLGQIAGDIDTIKRSMEKGTYADKLSSGFVKNVEKVVTGMEKSTKNNPGFSKFPQSKQTIDAAKASAKYREEKLTRTMIVMRPSANINSSSEVRKEFNKKFPEVALTAAIPTASGSLRLEFKSEQVKNEVVNKWETSMFGGNGGCRTPTTKPTVGIIKQVDTNESMEDIKEDIQTDYPGTDLDFFKKDGRLTGTIKLVFKDHDSYNKAMNNGGIKACGVKYNLEEFHMKPKVIRCYKCQGYGHISFRCRAKESRCGNCCEVGHEQNQCKKKITSPTCLHCKENHFTGSRICKEYKQVEEKMSTLYNHGF